MEEYCEIHNIIAVSKDYGYLFKRGDVGIKTDKNFMISCYFKVPTNLTNNGYENFIDIHTLLIFYNEIITRQMNDGLELVYILFSHKDSILKKNEVLMKIKISDKHSDMIAIDYTDIDRLHIILDLYPLLFLNRLSMSNCIKFVD